MLARRCGYAIQNSDTGCYLFIVSEREALAWVLENGRVAFPPRGSAVASGLKRGDRLLVYTARGSL